MRAFAPIAVLALASCSQPRPPRFADRPVATDERDGSPVSRPRERDDDTATMVSEAWLQGPLADGLDPRRSPLAADVNALDEVVRSAWFHPTPDADVAPAGPTPPLIVTGVHDDHVDVTDARGLGFELRVDDPEHPELASATAMVASRLVRALGWRTPEVAIVKLSLLDLAADADPRAAKVLSLGATRSRVWSTRWPYDGELGLASPMGTRHDDPNDRVPHEDRRSLRALGIPGGWLALEVGPRLVRDAYVGRPGLGHVEHFVVGLGGALGARRATTADPTSAEPPDDPLRNLLTFGFSDVIVPEVAAPTLPGMGELAPRAERPRVPMPWAPHSRATPADRYWAAKRLARLPATTIPAAVLAGELSDPRSRDHLRAMLEARRRATVATTFVEVSPAEPDGVVAGVLRLHDVGIETGIAWVPWWTVELLDEDGRAIAPPRRVPGGEGILVALPETFAYVVVRVTASGDGRRPMETHVSSRSGTPRVVGIRH